MLSLLDSKEKLQSEVTGKYLGLLEFLTVKFKSCKPSLDALFQLSQRIMPRYYTIASSSLMHPDEIRIAISLTEDEAGDKRKRLGFASQFLQDLF